MFVNLIIEVKTTCLIELTFLHFINKKQVCLQIPILELLLSKINSIDSTPRKKFYDSLTTFFKPTEYDYLAHLCRFTVGAIVS